jgi:hypothetical protein
MIQAVIHHPAVCSGAFLALVTLAFVVNRLGLIVWLAWMDPHKGDRREQKRNGEATKAYWRVHQ